MSAMVRVFGDGSIATYGAEEFVFVEISREMSLEDTLRGIALTDAIRSLDIPGITDICPSHVSYMLRINPDLIEHEALLDILQEIHTAVAASENLRIQGRLIDMPMYYQDPWTLETLKRFRDRHQSPETDDISYCARINGFDDVESFVTAHSSNPHIATFIGFMPGNAECYQLVPRNLTLEAPKYLRPRTDTPERALGFGGAFTNVYPVRGAGGFQLIGRTPTPVIDISQRLADFVDNFVMPRCGDIFKYRPIDADEYHDIRRDVKDGSFRFRMKPVEFDLTAFNLDPGKYNIELLDGLRSD